MKPLLLALISVLFIGHKAYSQNHVVVIDSSLAKPISDLAFVTKSGDFRFTNSIGQIVLTPKDFPVRIIDNQYANQIIKTFADTLHLFSKVQVLNEVVAAPLDLFEYFEKLQKEHKKMIVASLPDSLYAQITRFYSHHFDYDQKRYFIYQDQLHVLGVQTKSGRFDWYYQVVRNSFIEENRRDIKGPDSSSFFSFISIIPGLNELFEGSENLLFKRTVKGNKFKVKNYKSLMKFDPQKRIEFNLVGDSTNGGALASSHSIFMTDTIPIRYSSTSIPMNFDFSSHTVKWMHKYETKYLIESEKKNLFQTNYEYGAFFGEEGQGLTQDFRSKQFILWNTPPPETNNWKPWSKAQFDFNAPTGILEYIFQSVMERKIEEVGIDTEME